MAWSRGRRGPGKPPQTSEEYAKQFAETLIRQIEEGCAPWQKTWETGQRQLPRNIESEREYRGGNTLVLMATAEVRGYGDSRWGTYRQIIAAGGQVRKGERAMRGREAEAAWRVRRAGGRNALPRERTGHRREIDPRRERVHLNERASAALVDVACYRVVARRDVVDDHFGGHPYAASRGIEFLERRGMIQVHQAAGPKGTPFQVLTAKRRRARSWRAGVSIPGSAHGPAPSRRRNSATTRPSTARAATRPAGSKSGEPG